MMQRLLGFFICFAFFSASLDAQLQVGFSSTSTPNEGSVVDINVSVSNFNDLVSTQYSIVWDSLVLSYNSILNVTDDLMDFNAGSISTPDNTLNGLDGFVSVSWNEFLVSGITVPDETILFTLRLDVVGTSCDETSLSIGPNPVNGLPIEIVTSGLDVIDAVANPLPVMIPGNDCNGNPSGVGLVINPQSGQQGTNICVPVTVANFNDIQSAQGGLSWNPNVFEYTGVQNFGLPNLNEGLFNANNADQGNLSFVWIDNTGSNPATLADNTTIFEVCFDIVGSAGQSTIQFVDSPPIEFSDSDGNVLDFFTNDGTITVTPGMVTQEGLGIIAADVEAESGATVCVPVSVQDFADVQSAQAGISWDPSVIQYIEADNFGLPGLSESLFNANNAENGTLSFVWFDNSGVNPVTLNDGDIIFELCFNVIGQEGQSATISFINTPIIEFSDSTGSVIDPFFTQSGTVTVGTMPPPGIFGLNGADVTLTGGETSGCIDITTVNFTDISAIQLAMIWDESILNYTGIENLNGDLGFNTGTFNLTLSNELTLSWSSPSGLGQTVPDGTVLYSVCFDVEVCDQGANFNFVNGSQVDIEIGNGAAMAVPFNFGTTTMQANDCNGDPCPDPITATASINDIECFGASTGNITLNTFGGDGEYTCSWTNAAGVTVQSAGCNLLNVPAGTYTVNLASCDQQVQLNYTIAQPNSGISIIESIVEPGCGSQGSITANVSGGTPNYSYLWSTGQNTQTIQVTAGNYSLTVTDANFCQEIEMYTVNAGSEELNITAAINPADCSGGSIVIQENQLGATTPSYQWSNNLPNSSSQFGLLPGGYSVTVTDLVNGCSDTASFSINNVTPPISITNINSTSPTCNGASNGSYSFDINGGCTSTCQVQGSDGTLYNCDNLNNLPSGGYTIAISDNFDNQFNSSFLLEDPPLLTVVIENVSNATGSNGGQIDVTVSGGTPNYEFSWSDGVMEVGTTEDLFDVPEGNYILTVIDDNNCIATSESIPIIDEEVDPGEIIIFVASDFTGADITCPGECDALIDGNYGNLIEPVIITLTDAAGNATSYLDGFPLSNICAGDYLVNVSDDAGVSIDTSIVVEAPDFIQISQDIDGSECADPNQDNGVISIFVNGGVGGYDFNWSSSEEDDSATVEGLFSGMYEVTITDNNDCAVTGIFAVESCEKPDEECYVSNTVLTPNNDNFNDLLNINCSEDNPNSLEVYDRWGRLVYQSANYDNTWRGTDTDGTTLNEGSYFWVMEVDFGNGEFRIFKGYVTLLRNN